MRKIIYNLFFILLSVSSFAQAPQAFKYQAVVRDADGSIISNQQASIRITIHIAEVDFVVFQETHQAQTSEYGLITLNVGQGTPVIGSMSAIDWSNGYYMIEIEADPNGGDEYSQIGMSTILSVPYALYAETAGNAGTGGGGFWEGNDSNNIFYLDGNVGISTDQPEFKLTLDDDGGILAKGSINGGAILASTGYGSKMIWYPRKAAFRAGYQVGDEWNDAMIGDYSTGLGSTVEASGNYSFASGWSNVAAGQSSIAMGLLAKAYESSALAIGNSVESKGNDAMAIGQYSIAENDYSATFGRFLKASADGAMLIGSGTNSSSHLQNNIANSLMIGFSETPTMMVNNRGVGIGTTSFNSNYTLQVKATSGSFAIVGESIDQGGMYGYSTNGNGVYGFSSNGVGMYAGSFFGTALKAEHFGEGISANIIGKATGDENAVLVTENTNGGTAAKFITSGSSPALIIDQGNLGSMIRGYSLISDDYVLDIAGNGRISLYNGDHKQTVRIDPYESDISDGSAISLYNGSGTKTMSLDATSTGIFSTGSNISLYNTSGTKTMSLKASGFGSNDGSVISLYNASGTATVIIDGSHENGEGRITTNVLEITGGSDVAEPFDISGSTDILPGMVVSIDPDHAGKLKVSDQAYDKCVAGIISGAEGINTGLLLSQKGTIAEGEYPVALSGRVYCLATAANGEIQPGDLLTTSDIAGHVMKADDNAKMQGAIVGKAMMGLKDGTGTILVLVNLQ